jgi:hypothetical protein
MGCVVAIEIVPFQNTHINGVTMSSLIKVRGGIEKSVPKVEVTKTSGMLVTKSSKNSWL